jgi:hypothetical protein
MPKPAFIILRPDGEVLKTHSPDLTSTTARDVETLIVSGYQPIREIALIDGRVLLILSKP